MNENVLVPWSPIDPAVISPTAQPPDIVQLAVQLPERDQNAIVMAFKTGAYEMAATFVWSKALAALKKQLSTLGMEFVGEMLGRTDLDESSNPMTDIREDEAIELAEQLGMITTTEAIRLRNGQTLVNHFLVPEVSRTEQMFPDEAMTIVRSCVLNFLAQPDMRSKPFLSLRKKLETETLKEDSPEAKSLDGAPYFYTRTTLTVLLTQLKTAIGARLEHAAGNVNVLLPIMWPHLRDKDKWQAGETYAIVHAENRPVAAAGLRQALMRINGFDFVPETLRSETFRSAARAVISAHVAYDNFHNEPKPMAMLAKLGSSVPGPALADCLTAALCVRLGNRYGRSNAAQASANHFLNLFRPTQWEKYFNRVLPGDRRILEKLAYDDAPLTQWQEFITTLELDEVTLDPRIQKLVTADPKKRAQIKTAATRYRERLMQDP